MYFTRLLKAIMELSLNKNKKAIQYDEFYS